MELTRHHLRITTVRICSLKWFINLFLLYERTVICQSDRRSHCTSLLNMLAGKMGYPIFQDSEKDYAGSRGWLIVFSDLQVIDFIETPLIIP